MAILTRKTLILISALVLTGQAFAATGSAFLKIPNGAAEIALGQTGVSHATGGAAAWWNPALTGVHQGVSLQSFKGFGDGRGVFGAASVKTSFGGVGAYLFDLGTPGFESREVPGPSQGDFTIHNSVLALAASAALPFNLRTGVALKGTMDQILGAAVYDYPLLDAGLTWGWQKFMFGAAVANVELSQHNRDAAPATVRAGGTVYQPVGEFVLMGSGEVSSVKGIPPAYHAGVEAGWREKVYLRTGATMSDGEFRPAFGIGLVISAYTIDAATTVNDPLLGSTWRVGLGMKL